MLLGLTFLIHSFDKFLWNASSGWGEFGSEQRRLKSQASEMELGL